jgi:hypothetical protein
MNLLSRIAGINFLILIGYALLGAAIGSTQPGQDSAYGGMFIAMLIGVPIQCLVNLVVMIVAFARQETERGKAFLLSLLLVLLIGGGGGFFSCLMALNLGGGNFH